MLVLLLILGYILLGFLTVYIGIRVGALETEGYDPALPQLGSFIFWPLVIICFIGEAVVKKAARDRDKK